MMGTQIMLIALLMVTILDHGDNIRSRKLMFKLTYMYSRLIPVLMPVRLDLKSSPS